MVLRALEELMASDTVRGFQSEKEVEVALSLIDKVGADAATKLWAKGIEGMNHDSRVAWNGPIDDEILHVMVTDLTRPVDELTLEEITPASFPTIRSTQPIIIFKVG